MGGYAEKLPLHRVFSRFFFPRARQRKWFMFILRSEKPWKSLIRCLEDVTINKVDSNFPSFPLHIIQWSEWPKVCPNIILFRPSFIYRTTLPFTASHVQKPEFLSNLNKKNAFYVILELYSLLINSTDDSKYQNSNFGFAWSWKYEKRSQEYDNLKVS